MRPANRRSGGSVATSCAPVGRARSLLMIHTTICYAAQCAFTNLFSSYSVDTTGKKKNTGVQSRSNASHVDPMWLWVRTDDPCPSAATPRPRQLRGKTRVAPPGWLRRRRRLRPRVPIGRRRRTRTRLAPTWQGFRVVSVHSSYHIFTQTFFLNAHTLPALSLLDAFGL